MTPFIRSKVLGHRTDAGGGASVSHAALRRQRVCQRQARRARPVGAAAGEIVGDRGPDLAANENAPRGDKGLRSGEPIVHDRS